MTPTFWYEFFILLALALAGALAILPYSLRLLAASGKPLKMSVQKLTLLSFSQTAVICAIAIGIGLLAAHAIGLGAPYIEAFLTGSGSLASLAFMVEAALFFGVAAGALLLCADMLFLPHWPEALVDTARKTTLWENFTASFYGGINEELLMRLFGFSVLAWLLSLVWHTTTGTPTLVVFWVANIVIAILFGLGHLPALKGVAGEISHVMLVRALVLNAPVALICGWLFWTYGIEAAIIAHFSADIIYHVFGAVVLRRKLGVA
jgi:hypothetical protein